MNKILIFICVVFLMFMTSAVFAQTDQTKIILKNGTELVGVMKSLDPTSSVVLEICGMETTINIADVQSIQKMNATSAETAQAASSTDNAAALPKEKIVNICGKDIRFVLVEGGTFTYGYDEGGSKYVQTEPVHDITISPFYVSCEPVGRDLVTAVYGKNPYAGYTLKYNKEKLPSILKYDIKLGAHMPVPEKFEEIALFNAARNHSETMFGGKSMKNVEDFPYAKEFIEKLRSHTSEDIDMLDEGKWACIEHLRVQEVEYPMIPELVYSIDMNSKNDPRKSLIMHKGRGAALSLPGFRPVGEIPAFYNRGLSGAHDVDERDKEIELYEVGIGYVAVRGRYIKYTVAPMHLVINID